MKRLAGIWCVCAFLLGICAHAYAQADGTTCYKAIPLGKDFKTTINLPKTEWYTAWTYDLPLSVYFIPVSQSFQPPEVMMDFGCSPGIYADPILCMLFCKGALMSKEIPNYPKLSTTTVDGKFAYYLSMGKTYRDLLLKMGIDYNVQVFIRVTYSCGGEMSIAPDNMFSSCMDSAKFIHLGDTVRIKAQDTVRHVVVPYIQWKNENILYSWTGTQPCKMIVSSDCRTSVLDDGSDPDLLQNITLQSGESFAVTKQNIRHYVDFVDNEAGMFFVKGYSTSDGVLKIEREPVAPPRGQAQLLYYDQEQILLANDTNALYAISDEWEEATKFIVPTNHIFRMYVDSTPNFHTSDALFSYTFDRDGNGGHVLTLDKTTMTNLWKKKSKNDSYLYIRFACNARTTITGSVWDPSPCMQKTNVIKTIQKNDSINLRNPSYYTDYYRLRYADWEGGDMTFTWWIKAADCKVAIGDSCEFDVANGADHVIKYFVAQKRTNTTQKPYTITADEVAQWKPFVDEDGFLYLRFNSDKYQGWMTFKTNAPDESNPTYPASTISVKCEGTQVMVHVSEAQHIAIKDSSSAIVDQWDATPGQAHTINLPDGKYTLEGENEKIEINL